MALSSSFPAVDPRPTVRRVLVNSSGLTTGGGGYVPNSQLGNALVFTGATRKSGGYGMISTATVVDKANTLGAIDLWLFSQSVTPAQDGSAISFSDSDMNYYVGTISFPAPTNLINNRAISVPAIGLNYQCQDTSLYGYIATLTAHNAFNSVDDLVVGLTLYMF